MTTMPSVDSNGNCRNLSIQHTNLKQVERPILYITIQGLYLRMWVILHHIKICLCNIYPPQLFSARITPTNNDVNNIGSTKSILQIQNHQFMTDYFGVDNKLPVQKTIYCLPVITQMSTEKGD